MTPMRAKSERKRECAVVVGVPLSACTQIRAILTNMAVVNPVPVSVMPRLTARAAIPIVVTQVTRMILEMMALHLKSISYSSPLSRRRTWMQVTGKSPSCLTGGGQVLFQWTCACKSPAAAGFFLWFAAVAVRVWVTVAFFPVESMPTEARAQPPQSQLVDYAGVLAACVDCGLVGSAGAASGAGLLSSAQPERQPRLLRETSRS